MNARPRALDLFAGIGLFSEGLHRAGYETVAACEISDRKRMLLRAVILPCAPVYRDIKELTGERVKADVGSIDLVFGSPPCTDISPANSKGRGVDGEQSSLYFEAIRLVSEIRPRWACFENSDHLRAKGADRIIDALEREGYACWPLVVGAFHAGAPHRRRRSWVVAARTADAGDADGEHKTTLRGIRGGTDAERGGAVPADPHGHGRGLLGGRDDGRGLGRDAQAAEPLPADTDSFDGRPGAQQSRHTRRNGREAVNFSCDPADPYGPPIGRDYCDRGSACAFPNECEDPNDCWLARHPEFTPAPDPFMYPEYAPDADCELVRQQSRRGSGAHGQDPAVLGYDDAPDPDGAGLAFWESLAGDHGPQLAALEREIGPVIHTWAGGLGRYLRVANGMSAKAARFCMSAFGDAVVVEPVEAIGRAILVADNMLRRDEG